MPASPPALRRLALTKFRRFREHEIVFAPRTLLVGANNAGKSTAVQALLLVSLVTNRLRGLNFTRAPDWLAETPAAPWGVRPSLRGIDITLGQHVFHAYEDPPAEVRAEFATGWTVDVFIGIDDVFAVIRDPVGRAIAARRDVPTTALPRMAIQPQVGPVERGEVVLADRTVIEGLRASASAAHFRNQLRLFVEDLPALRDAAAETWPGLDVRELEVPALLDTDAHLSLEVRDGAFVGELATMGHGLQMWLQMLWFLVRSQDAEVVVLDEPDVYMHPDLQRRLLRHLERRSQQVIVATHSVEMMSEVEPEEIVTVDATRRRSRRARNLADAQKAIALIGGVHNLQLQRLWRAKRVIFVEGRDLDILKRLHRTQFPRAPMSLDANPNMETGGWSGWPMVPLVARFLREAAEQDLPIYCMLDSDYHWPEQLAERREQAADASVNLTIWNRKELENLVLVPDAVHRALIRGGATVTREEVRHVMNELADDFRDVVIDGYADSDAELHRGHQPSTCHALARDHVEPLWTDLESKLRRVPGKQYGRRVSGWSQETYGVSLGPRVLARELALDEFDAQLSDTLAAIEEVRPPQTSEELDVPR